MVYSMNNENDEMEHRQQQRIRGRSRGISGGGNSQQQLTAGSSLSAFDPPGGTMMTRGGGGGNGRDSPTHYSTSSSQQAIKRPSSRKKPAREAYYSNRLKTHNEEMASASIRQQRQVPQPLFTQHQHQQQQYQHPKEQKESGQGYFQTQISSLVGQCRSADNVSQKEAVWTADGRPVTPTAFMKRQNATPPYDPVTLYEKQQPLPKSPFQRIARKMERQKKKAEDCGSDMYEGYKDMCTTQRAINLETNSFFSGKQPATATGYPDLRSASTISSKRASTPIVLTPTNEETANNSITASSSSSSRYYADGMRKTRPTTPISHAQSSLLGDKITLGDETAGSSSVSQSFTKNNNNKFRSAESSLVGGGITLGEETARSTLSSSQGCAKTEPAKKNPQEDSRDVSTDDLESDSDDFEVFPASARKDLDVQRRDKFFQFPMCSKQQRPQQQQQQLASAAASNAQSLSRMRVQENAILDLSMELEDTKRDLSNRYHALHLQKEEDEHRLQDFQRREAQYEATIAVMEQRLTRELKEKDVLKQKLKATADGESNGGGKGFNGSGSSGTASSGRDAKLVSSLREEIHKLKQELAATKESDSRSASTPVASGGGKAITSPKSSDSVASRAELQRLKTKLEKTERELRKAKMDMECTPSNAQLLGKVIAELQAAKKKEENLTTQLAKSRNELADAKERERELIRERSTNETLEMRARIIQLEKDAEMVRTQSREELQGRREESYKLKDDVKYLKEKLAEVTQKAAKEAKEQETDRKVLEAKLFAAQNSTVEFQDTLRVVQEKLVKAESAQQQQRGSAVGVNNMNRSYEAEIAVLHRKLQTADLQIKEERKLAFDIDKRRIEEIQHLRNQVEDNNSNSEKSPPELEKILELTRGQLRDAHEEIQILRRVSYGTTISPDRAKSGFVSPKAAVAVKESPHRSPTSYPSIDESTLRSPEQVKRSKEHGFFNPPFTPNHHHHHHASSPSRYPNNNSIPRHIRTPSVMSAPISPTTLSPSTVNFIESRTDQLSMAKKSSNAFYDPGYDADQPVAAISSTSDEESSDESWQLHVVARAHRALHS